MTDAPTRIRVAQDANGFWTCRKAVSGSQEYVRADLYAALESRLVAGAAKLAAVRFELDSALLREDNERHNTKIARESLNAEINARERAEALLAAKEAELAAERAALRLAADRADRAEARRASDGRAST